LPELFALDRVLYSVFALQINSCTISVPWLLLQGRTLVKRISSAVHLVACRDSRLERSMFRHETCCQLAGVGR
jgi:hypothetical protein